MVKRSNTWERVDKRIIFKCNDSWMLYVKGSARGVGLDEKYTHFIRRARNIGEERGSQEIATLSSDLNEIEEGLLQFLPEERELAES